VILALSRRQRQSARRALFRHSFWNACGFGLTTGPVLSLLALHHGATDGQTGLLYAAVFVTGWAALLTPMLLNGRETTGIWAAFWWLRGGLSFFYLLLPLVSAPDARVWTLVALFYGFSIARSMGMAAAQPVQKALATARELPAQMSRGFGWAHLGLLAVNVLSFAVFRRLGPAREGLGFSIVMAVGAGSNLISSLYISRMPKTGYLEHGNLSGLRRAAAMVFSRAEYREALIVIVLNTGLVVCMGYMVNALRNAFALGNSDVFLFGVLALVGSIGASWLMLIIGHRVSSAALLVFSHLVLVAACGLWVFAGSLARLGPYALLAAYLPAAIAGAVSGQLAFRLRTDRLPPGLEVQTSVVYQTADVFMALLAVGLIRLVGPSAVALPLPGAHAYSGVFALAAAVSLSVVLVALRLKRETHHSVLEDLALLAPANLLAIYRAHRIAEEAAPSSTGALEDLLARPSPLSRRLIRESLRSADLGRRLAALRALCRTPLPETFDAVLAEASDPASPLRPEALTSMGFLQRPEARAALRPLLADDDPGVRAAALKSLCRLGDPRPEAEVEAVWAACATKRQRLDVLAGLAAARRRAPLLRFVGEELRARPGWRWSRVVLATAANGWRRGAEMTEMFEADDDRLGGPDYLRGETAGRWPPAPAWEELAGLVDRNAFGELAERLRRDGGDAAGWVAAHDRSTALGALYLWFLARTPEEE